MDACQIGAATTRLWAVPRGKAVEGRTRVHLSPTIQPAARANTACNRTFAAHKLPDPICILLKPTRGFSHLGQCRHFHLDCAKQTKVCCKTDDSDPNNGRQDGFDSSELLDSFRKAKERQRIAVLFEVEGVLTDMNRRANREAFNSAFKTLDLDCANWSEPIYKDLYRSAGGDEERMLQIFFDRIGWPLAVATNERTLFTKKCLEEKKKQLEGFIEASRLPLRPGVEEFVQEAAADGVVLIALGVTKTIGPEATRKLVAGLGAAVQVLSDDDVKGSLYTQVATGKGALAGADNMLARKLSEAVNAEKQRLAEMVAEKLKLTVDLDNGGKSDAALLALRAAAEKAETPVGRCILLAGSHAGVQAAARISMPCVAVKSSFTAGAEFPGACATYGDYGSGSGLTLAKLRRCMEAFHAS